MDPINQLYFYFIGISIISLDIDKAIGLAINKNVLIGTDIIIGFFKLFYNK